MRISTNTLFDSGTKRMGELQSSLAKTQQQLATGRRILSPSDDPVGAAQALELTQAQAMNSQYAVNRQNAKNALGMEENVLQSVTTLLQDVKTLTVNAGNGVLDDTQRKYIATELSGRFDELLGLANTRDGAGNYLFSGYQTSTQPFTQTLTGAAFSGDQGVRMLQVGPLRQLAISDAGSAVFESNKTGNGRFVTGTGTTNAGTGVISPGAIVDSTALTGHSYAVDFTVSGTTTTFNVYDVTSDPGKTTPLLPASGPYTSGQSITFDGLQFDIKGTPANGDSFTVKPSGNQSVFTTIRDLINVLSQPATTDVGKTNLANGLNAAHAGIDSALDSILTTRASVGARLKEIDTLDTQGDDKDLLYSESLSALQDLDYTKAITDLSKQKIMLDAAQQSFVKTTGLSLFNFIS